MWQLPENMTDSAPVNTAGLSGGDVPFKQRSWQSPGIGKGKDGFNPARRLDSSLDHSWPFMLHVVP